MQMPNRKGGKYRFGFNGMEADDEVKGGGNSYTTEYRQLDVRLGRWLSIDPLFASFPHQSPYVTFDNNPVLLVDPRGLAASGGGDPPKDDGTASGGDVKDGCVYHCDAHSSEYDGWYLPKANLSEVIVTGQFDNLDPFGSEVDYELQPIYGWNDWVNTYGNPYEGYEYNLSLWSLDFRLWKVLNEVDPNMPYQDAIELWYAQSGLQRYDVAKEFGILYLTYATLKEPAEMYITNTMFIGALGLGVGAAWFAPGAIRAMQNFGRSAKDLTSGSGWMQFATGGNGYFNIASSARTAHILAGDGLLSASGGHHWFGSPRAFYNGLTGQKSMFPITWSKAKTMHAISEVGFNNPWINQTGKQGVFFVKSGNPAKFKAEGYYDGVRIRVIIQGNDIITAFPIK